MTEINADEKEIQSLALVIGTTTLLNYLIHRVKLKLHIFVC